jgi:polar amino acid transport system permease protein
VNLLLPLLPGLGLTVLVFLGGTVVAATTAFLFGLGRLSNDPIVRGVSRTYVEVFRGTSLLVQLYWFAFAFPMLLGIRGMPNLVVAIVITGLNVGAYGAEVVRGAIQAVPREQIEAAIALNLTEAQRMRRIVLPQAIVGMLPPFGNLLIELLKSTALVSMIFITELTRAAEFVRDHTGRPVAVLGIVLVLYFLLSLLIGLCVRLFERRASRRWRLKAH